MDVWFAHMSRTGHGRNRAGHGRRRSGRPAGGRPRPVFRNVVALIRFSARLVGYVVIGVAAALCVTLVSFAHFLWIIDAGEGQPGRPADAIVALSGDPSRVTRAAALLAGGFGERLFVAGVDNADEIARQSILHPKLFACCVDVEHHSMTTHEDATAIADWAQSRHVRSLIVVTSSSHLPRALVEVRDALPGVTLVPSGVTRGMVDFTDWRSDPKLWPLLGREFIKTIGTLVLNRLPFRLDLDMRSASVGSGRSG